MNKSEILLDIVTSLRSLATCIEASAASMLMDAEPEDPAPNIQEETTALAKVITLEEIRSTLADKSLAGFTDAVRGLLEKYGAPKLSQIDPANYSALMADAEALK